MANIPGFPGYNSWGQAEAQADFAATGGVGKGTDAGRTSNGSSGSGFQPITVADFSKLEQDAFNLLKPYYLQLAQESRGDFNRAVKTLEEDYIVGTRQATEDYLKESGRTKQDLASTMKSLGLQEAVEGEGLADSMNRRGAAVYQMSPNGQFNVMNEGLGGKEADRLRQNQALRKEAQQRTADRRLEDLGITQKRFTNPSSTNANGLPSTSGDRTTMGQAERSYIRTGEDATRSQQLREQELFTKRRAEAQGMASTMAGINQRTIPETFANRYTESTMNDWINKGV